MTVCDRGRSRRRDSDSSVVATCSRDFNRDSNLNRAHVLTPQLHVQASRPSPLLPYTLNAVQDSNIGSQPSRGFFAGGGAPAAGVRAAGLEFHLAAYRLMSNLRLHPS